jgi:transposase
MDFIQGTPRNQIFLFNECLDNIIPDDHHIRFIDAYVNKLDIFQLGFVIPQLRTGTPPYDPRVLLKIYIYGYFEKIRSSRRIEAECKRNNEMRWLSGDLVPDFWTIAQFRRKNKTAFKAIFKEFLNLCHKLKLISLEVVAADSTKIRGQNHSQNVYRRDAIEEISKKVNEKIDEYMCALDENDKNEEGEAPLLSSKDIQKFAQLIKYRDKVNKIEQVFNEHPEIKTFFSTDPDASLQKDRGKTDVGYLCETAVDEKNKLIIANDVTNDHDDSNRLTPMVDNIIETKRNLIIQNTTTVVTDSKYFNGSAILASEMKDGINVVLPHPRDIARERRPENNPTSSSAAHPYNIDQFKYNQDRDAFVCPEGSLLYCHGKGSRKGKKKLIYSSYVACKKCTKRETCTSSKNGRTLFVNFDHAPLHKFREKMKTRTCVALIKKRKEIVEHPFGTLKRTMGFTYFLLRGMDNVKAEFSFMCFIYDLKRILKMFSVRDLIACLELNT